MKGIMFNEHFGLESAVLQGRKTQTRRIVKFNKDIIIDNIGWSALVKKGFYEVRGIHADGTYGSSVFRMPYQVGEVVAIKQSYCLCVGENPKKYADKEIIEMTVAKGWRNKMFVKNALMPHRIKITSIRVERLQEISEEDCLKEGISRVLRFTDNEGKEINEYTHRSIHGKHYYASFDTPQEAFASLIDKVSGKGTWEKNPFVWVYDFELKTK